MKRLVLLILAILVVLAQMSLLPALRPLGVVPNLALVFITLIGLGGTASTTLVAAVLGGFLLDLASGANFGLWTGTFVLVALVTGLLHRAGIEAGGAMVALVTVAAGTIIMAIVILSGLIASAHSWPIGTVALKLLTEIVLNLSLTLALRPLIRFLLPNLQPNAMMMD
jgi:rod shape-determining protein MreD